MHLQFYHLNRPPFQLATDLDFFWEGTNYVKSSDVLKYSLEHHGGLSLLTGKAGSGKSLVVRALLDALGNSVRAAVIPDSSLTGQEFYDLVAHGFDLPGTIENRQDFHDRIHGLLKEARANKQQVLLVVDEAQQLSRELIDEIGELINLQPVDSGGLGICLVGQADTAQDPATRISQAFENHVIVRYHLAPFTVDETGEYIRHRLKVAGADRPVFTDDAIREIHQCSGGYPGQINIICDLALFTGCTENAAEIGPAIIQTSAAKLQFPGTPGKPEDNCPAVTPFDKEANDHVAGSEGNGGALPATDDITVPVPIDEAGGRSFAMPALAVLVALVFAGGGYALYTKSRDPQLIVEPTVVESVSIVDTVADPVDETEKVEEDFDAVGYSPPSEDSFLLQQPAVEKAVTTAATDTDLPPAGDSLPENAEEVVGEPVAGTPESPQDRLEVQALQVEESLSVIPVAVEASTPERVDAEIPSLQESVSTEVAKEDVAGTETVLEEKTVDLSSPAAESIVEQSVVSPESEESFETSVTSAVVLPGNDEAGTTVSAVDEGATVELVETPSLQESVPVAILEPTDAETETAPAEEKVEVTSAAEPVVEPVSVSKQQQAMDVETPLTGTELGMDKKTDTTSAGARNPELEHFFEAGAFVSQSSSSPQVIKTTKHTRTAGASRQKEIKMNSTSEPDPEDVIDWLLKKKEHNAK